MSYRAGMCGGQDKQVPIVVVMSTRSYFMKSKKFLSPWALNMQNPSVLVQSILTNIITDKCAEGPFKRGLK